MRFQRLRFLLLLLPLALWLALPFVLPFTERTPAVFSLRLLLVTTPVFDETLLRFALAGMFAFVSNAPWRGGLPALLLFAFAPALVLSWAPQPLRAAAPMRTNASTKLGCILF